MLTIAATQRCRFAKFRAASPASSVLTRAHLFLLDVDLAWCVTLVFSADDVIAGQQPKIAACVNRDQRAGDMYVGILGSMSNAMELSCEMNPMTASVATAAEATRIQKLRLRGGRGALTLVAAAARACPPPHATRLPLRSVALE